MQTIGSLLDRRRGIAPGFDILRVLLAVGVVVWHGRAIVHGDTTPGGRFFELGSYGIIASFFGLSGFLITASALRLRLRDFLTNRALRIVPALAVEVILSALVLGPLFTDLPLGQYFSESGTYRYFANILGAITYTLPGVFAHNPTNIVNTSLWTIPHEMICYAIMSACVLTGALRRPWLVLAMAGAVVALGFAVGLGAADGLPAPAMRVADRMLAGDISRLYVAFLLGIAVYLLRYRIPFHRGLIGAAVAVVILFGAFDLTQTAALPRFPVMNLILLPALIYLTACVGVTDVWVPPFLRRGDYSYGIYLYGWPIQQAMVALVPDRRIDVQLLLALPCILAFAMVSWHAIERPILGLRKRFSFVAARRLSEDPATGVVPDAGRI